MGQRGRAKCPFGLRGAQGIRRTALAGLKDQDFAEEGYFVSDGRTTASGGRALMGIPGMAFSDAWERREETNFGGLRVPFISRRDLIAAKRAAGRPQDLLDAHSLTQVEPPDQA